MYGDFHVQSDISEACSVSRRSKGKVGKSIQSNEAHAINFARNIGSDCHGLARYRHDTRSKPQRWEGNIVPLRGSVLKWIRLEALLLIASSVHLPSFWRQWCKAPPQTPQITPPGRNNTRRVIKVLSATWTFKPK